MSVPSAIFGPGILILTRTDVTPGIAINVGYAQEVTLDFAGTTKSLFGQYQFPLVAARGTIKATGKIKAATLSGLAMNACFFGQTFSTALEATGSPGVFAWNIASTYTTSTSSSQIQVGSSVTFDADLGIIYAASGLPLQRVSTGSEATGKYSITTGSPGLYNFASGDQPTGGANLKVTYTSQTNVTGSSLQQALLVNNQLIGTTPTFQLDYYTNLNQPSISPYALRLYACVTSKLSMPFKLEDFMIPEYDFDIFANASNQILDFVSPNIA